MNKLEFESGRPDPTVYAMNHFVVMASDMVLREKPDTYAQYDYNSVKHHLRNKKLAKMLNSDYLRVKKKWIIFSYLSFLVLSKYFTMRIIIFIIIKNRKKKINLKRQKNLLVISIPLAVWTT